jgi:hypothetical protein
MSPCSAFYLLQAGLLLGLFVDPADGGDDVVFQKIELLITTAVSTSNPTEVIQFGW